jgi:SRSO17 transposase
MGACELFDRYMNRLSDGLGHLDHHAGLKGYCTGLMLPLSRKSVEPMAQPLPAADAALVAEAIRLHALGRTL